MREIKLDSGAVLKVSPSPFMDAKALYQALLVELRAMRVTLDTDRATLFKEMFTAGFSSPIIEACLWKCMERCIYVDDKSSLKIDHDTFEPVERRQDFMTVCMEVAKENVGPFMKSLYVHYLEIMKIMPNTQA